MSTRGTGARSNFHPPFPSLELPLSESGLPPQTELLDQGAVALEVRALEVVEQAAAAPDELEQAAARVVVLRVRAQVLGELVDPGVRRAICTSGEPVSPSCRPCLPTISSLASLVRVMQPPFRRLRNPSAPSEADARPRSRSGGQASIRRRATARRAPRSPRRSHGGGSRAGGRYDLRSRRQACAQTARRRLHRRQTHRHPRSG